MRRDFICCFDDCSIFAALVDFRPLVPLQCSLLRPITEFKAFFFIQIEKDPIRICISILLILRIWCYLFFIAQFLFTACIYWIWFVGICFGWCEQTTDNDRSIATDQLECNWTFWKFQIRLNHPLFTDFQHSNWNFQRTIYRRSFNLLPSAMNCGQNVGFYSILFEYFNLLLTSTTLNSPAFALWLSISCLIASR